MDRKLICLAAFIGMMLLSGCSANFITDIQSDGSGIFTQEYIFTVDELTSYGVTVTEMLCGEDLEFDMSTMPPGTTLRQEEDESEVSCIFETPFEDLEGLRFIYSDYMDGSIDDLRIEGGKLYYDITFAMGEGETAGLAGFSPKWIVNMPGSVSEHNADLKEGNILTWDMPTSGDFHVTATGNAGGVSSTAWWIIGIGSACLCLVVLIAVVVLVIVLMRRKKKQEPTSQPG